MPSRSNCHSFLALVAILVLPAFAVAEKTSGPTSRPTSQPSIAQLFHALSDANADTRDYSAQQLMSLTPEELPELRELVRANLPLPPGEWETLEEVVKQIVMSSVLDDRDLDHGFIGVQMSRQQEPVYIEDPTDSGESLGVIVYGRTPGFAAFQMLRDGDLIASITAPDPSLVVPGEQEHVVHTSTDLAAVVGMLPSGTEISLSVLRGGKRQQVQITLGGRPRCVDEINLGAYEQYLEAAMRKADEYWNEQFAPLFERSIS